jgi:hypothetical protein
MISIYQACYQSPVKNMKDLDDNMMDVRIYQENLGDEIRAGTLNDAEWLLEGMDSILLLLGEKFTEHRKLTRGFAYYYKRELKKPINMIRLSIRENDTSMAMKGYKLLIKNCNSCHMDHEIDKTVKE